MPSVIIGDYRYSTTSAGTAMVNVVDTTKTSYGEILSSVEIGSVTYSVTSMSSCFEICTSLTTAPEIPSSVTSMSSCFRNCTSLTTAPVIPSSVTDMNGCFSSCTALYGDIFINSTAVNYTNCFHSTTQPITLHGVNTSFLSQLASTATNNNVYVNTTPTPIPSTIQGTNMYYQQTQKTPIQLSPQTDASLVSVEVPFGNGTITTTLQDALLDLYQRAGEV